MSFVLFLVEVHHAGSTVPPAMTIDEGWCYDYSENAMHSCPTRNSPADQSLNVGHGPWWDAFLVLRNTLHASGSIGLVPVFLFPLLLGNLHVEDGSVLEVNIRGRLFWETSK